MNYLGRLLLTIGFNLAVLATSVGWLGAQDRGAYARTSVAGREFTVTVDRDAWYFDSGVFPFR